MKISKTPQNLNIQNLVGMAYKALLAFGNQLTKYLIRRYDTFFRTSVIEKEDWKNVIDLVTNAKQVVSSAQDVARKLADYANFRRNKSSTGKLLCSGSKLNFSPKK